MIARLRLAGFFASSVVMNAVAVAAICHTLHGDVLPARLQLLTGESALQVRLVPAMPNQRRAPRAEPRVEPVERFQAREPTVSEPPPRPVAERALRSPSRVTFEPVCTRPVRARPVAAERPDRRVRRRALVRPDRPRGQPRFEHDARVDAPAAQHEADARPKGARTPVRVRGLTRPTYPRGSRRRGEEGTVVFSVEVRTDGSRGEVRRERSSGFPRLDRAARRALERATFLPARLNGRPVASRRTFSFRFQLVDAGQSP